MAITDDETFETGGPLSRQNLPVDMMRTVHYINQSTNIATTVHILYGYGYRFANVSEAFREDLVGLGIADKKALQTFCGQWIESRTTIQGFESLKSCFDSICPFCIKQAPEKFLMLHEHYVGGGAPNKIIRGLVILYPLTTDKWIEGLRKLAKDELDTY